MFGIAAQVRIKLKHMEIEIRRRESTGAGTSARSDSETLAKYEIMDGAPVRGESIPIRCYYYRALSLFSHAATVEVQSLDL